MTTTTTPYETAAAGGIWSGDAAQRNRRRRHAADRRLQIYGIAAITTAVGLLLILLTSLISTGYIAFVQTKIAMPFVIDAAEVEPDDIQGANWRSIVSQSIEAEFPEFSAADQRIVRAILTNQTQFLLRNAVAANPSLIGQTVVLSIPASDPYDQLNKGTVDRATPEARRRVSDADIRVFDELDARGMVSTPFNWALFTNADSRFPELAGLLGAIVGSFYALLVCFMLSFPIGIAAALYLEEFAPRNRITDIIEVNINNLAAVPSIVFGLLALAVFLNFFGLPRSAPLVGGMALALITLPTIIIVTRAALKSVPPSIREGALGVGASRHQVVWHHVLPLALPGILTGTIIGLAQALGETAPLLLIGMNAFITSPPGGILDSATALPTQIFIWADSPERGFVSRTSAAILVLLMFLLVMNAIAIFLRNRLERKW